jgi:acyl-ACP thioesterase
LQDAAAEHAATLNVGMDELAEMKLIWVLSRLKIRLDSPVTLGDDFEVLTYPCGIQRIFAHRCYELLVNKKRIGTGGSFWLPVNTLVNRPVAAKKVLPPEITDMPDVEKFFSDMDKLPDDCGEFYASRTVGAGDIDLNCHLNNAVYARWISDLLGEKYQTGAIRVKEIQLNYLSSGQFKEEILLACRADDSGNFAIAGQKTDGTAVFQAAGIVDLQHS